MLPWHTHFRGTEIGGSPGVIFRYEVTGCRLWPAWCCYCLCWRPSVGSVSWLNCTWHWWPRLTSLQEDRENAASENVSESKSAATKIKWFYTLSFYLVYCLELVAFTQGTKTTPIMLGLCLPVTGCPGVDLPSGLALVGASTGSFLTEELWEGHIFPASRLCAFTAGAELRERPFHYLGGGLEELFSADYFFTWCLKLDFFFTHQLKPDFFFTKNWKSDYFFMVMFQVKDIYIFTLFSGLRQDYFFCNISKQKKFFNVQAGPNYFFWPKAAPDYFFKNSSSPPPPDNEMGAP